jgi:hypothetical protein
MAVMTTILALFLVFLILFLVVLVISPSAHPFDSFSLCRPKQRCNPKLFGLALPLSLPYLVLECADDYSHTVVGMPNRDYLWIMARTPHIEDELYIGMCAVIWYGVVWCDSSY